MTTRPEHRRTSLTRFGFIVRRRLARPFPAEGCTTSARNRKWLTSGGHIDRRGETAQSGSVNIRSIDASSREPRGDEFWNASRR